MRSPNFLVLWIAELFYRLGFSFVCWFKRLRGNKGPFSFKIISVGNLSVGGTGKSVVVPKIIETLGFEQCAIVMRGYGGTICKTRKSALVSDGNQVFVDAAESGDEAMMYAQQLKVPVVVGANRARSCELLEQLKRVRNKKINFVVLDDAYQNFDVKKDCQILLLDARLPFENGRCLPAGRLREKDATRANLIILTHADEITEQQLEQVKRNVQQKAGHNKIFAGKHTPVGIFYQNQMQADVTGKRLGLVAGVGSFSGVLATAQKAGVNIVATKEYADHVAYGPTEIYEIVTLIKTHHLDGIVITSKDWVKLSPLLAQQDIVLVYVLRVAFEFLTGAEHTAFIQLLKQTL